MKTSIDPYWIQTFCRRCQRLIAEFGCPKAGALPTVHYTDACAICDAAKKK